jgi:hypothetical protein
MTRSAIGDVWFDLYDSVAMLQSLGNDETSLEEDEALDAIVAVLDKKDPKGHENLMQDILENLSDSQLADLFDQLNGDDNEDED